MLRQKVAFALWRLLNGTNNKCQHLSAVRCPDPWPFISQWRLLTSQRFVYQRVSAADPVPVVAHAPLTLNQAVEGSGNVELARVLFLLSCGQAVSGRVVR